MIFRQIFSVFLFLLTFSPLFLKAQYISVDTNYTAEQLVRDIFFGSGGSACIQVENISINGQDFGTEDKSFGYFNSNGSAFELEEGILLTTGKLLSAIGPNNYILSDGDNGWAGDQDLEIALNIRDTYNATILEFDFTPTNVNRVSFEYLFASEQYLTRGTPAQCNYTDGFAFLIRPAGTLDPYTNLAVIPGTDIPITSSNVRGPGGLCPAINEAYFGQFNPDESPTNFNGQTKILTAATDVIPGVKYHLKLVIADQGNELYDSGVFLKAGGFLANKDLGSDRILSEGTALCENSSLVLDATTSGATYQWLKDGVRIPSETSETFTVTTAGLYEVMIDQPGCRMKGSIKIEYAALPLVKEKSFCNYNNGAPVSISLQNLNREIITNDQPNFEVTYYEDSALQIPLPNNFNYSGDVTIYAKVESGNCAPVITPIHLQTPTQSLLLTDQTICPSSTTTLEVEGNFIYYKWMRENREIIAEGQLVNEITDVAVGKYFVELTSQNGCSLEQTVSVLGADLPAITHIDVAGSIATINVLGGIFPYEYSRDGINFQSSNIFKNIPRGLHKVYVRDAQKCVTLEKEFLVINLINVITPNGDGKNDVMDYSDLKIKDDVKLKVFDRNGSIVYQSSPQIYIWDGKLHGRALPTGTYWYHISWTEPDTQLPVNYSGWILLKNRN